MSVDNCYVLISAGGAGTRLWPLSRRAMPKQFQKFGTTDTLLQHMVELTTRVVPLDHTYIMTVAEFVPLIQEQLPALPAKNILIEPARRDNGPAIALAMLQLHQINPQATAAVLWADHLVKNAEAFTQMLTTAFEAAAEHPTQLITVGTKPTSPDTGLGYIYMGQELKKYDHGTLFEVKRFIEKPDLDTATTFVSSGEYLWNVGYKVMNVQAFLEQLAGVQPTLSPLLQQLEEALKNQQNYDELYGQFPKLSIEYLFTPFLQHILVIPTDMGWSDIGNWNVLHEMLQDGNTLVTKGPVETIDTSNSLIFAKDKLITVIGLEDVIIVDSGDAILVMHKDNTHAIKDVHSTLAKTNPDLL